MVAMLAMGALIFGEMVGAICCVETSKTVVCATTNAGYDVTNATKMMSPSAGCWPFPRCRQCWCR